jgi:hypothetical protein
LASLLQHPDWDSRSDSAATFHFLTRFEVPGTREP